MEKLADQINQGVLNENAVLNVRNLKINGDYFINSNGEIEGDGILYVTIDGDLEQPIKWGVKTKVYELCVSNITKKSIKYLPSNYKEARFSDIDDISSLKELNISKRCKELYLENISIKDLEGLNNKVNTLNITNCNNFTSLKGLTSSCRDLSLHNLPISNLQYIDVVNDRVHIEGCHNIKSFSDINDNINTINITNCDGLVDINSIHGRIEMLIVKDCDNIRNISANNLTLSVLDVFNCKNVKSIGYIQFKDSTNRFGYRNPIRMNAQYCPNLEFFEDVNRDLVYVNITKCPKLSKEYLTNYFNGDTKITIG